MRIKIILTGIGVTVLMSCSPPTPEILAKESCECFQKAKTQKNTDNQLEQNDICFALVQGNLNRLRQIEKEQDMTDEQVVAFEARFNKVYDKCK